jgi:hypothetical protein
LFSKNQSNPRNFSLQRSHIGARKLAAKLHEDVLNDQGEQNDGNENPVGEEAMEHVQFWQI